MTDGSERSHPTLSASMAFGASIVLALSFCLALWPAFTLVAAAVAGILALSRWYPGHAFVLAVVLFALEGSVKVLLSLGETPSPFSPEAVGAGLLDVALFGSAAVLVLPRSDELVRLWQAFGRSERIVVGALVGWLVLAVVQIFQSGHPTHGLEGFRLTQLYVAAALAGAVLARVGTPTRFFTMMLTLLALVAGYAALRAVIGPATAERTYAVSRGGVTEFQFGHVFRTVGSFSGAVGLVSFLAPPAVFALGIALFMPRLRAQSLAVFALGVAAVAGAQVRVGLIALAVGLLAFVGLALRSHLLVGRRKSVVIAVVLGALITSAGAVVVVSRASPETEQRAHGFLDPFHDRSVRLRLHTWRESLEAVRDKPLGTGLGTVGASTGHGGPKITADNSYLKVFREQGIAGGVLFVVGLFGLWILTARRRSDTNAECRLLTAAALAGVAAFLVLAAAGEYVEQPGKVLTWMLLGFAVSLAFLPVERGVRLAPQSWTEWRSRGLRLAEWLAVAVLVAVPVITSTLRATNFEAAAKMAPASADSPSKSEVEALLSNKVVRNNVVAASGFLVDPRSLEGHVKVRRVARRYFISASADTPTRARDLAEAIAALITAASPEPLVIARHAQAPRPARAIDRAIVRLPGDPPPRPHPVFAAFAALALAALFLAFVRRQSGAVRP